MAYDNNIIQAHKSTIVGCKWVTDRILLSGGMDGAFYGWIYDKTNQQFQQFCASESEIPLVLVGM